MPVDNAQKLNALVAAQATNKSDRWQMPSQPILPSIRFGKQLRIWAKRLDNKPDLVRNIADLLKGSGCRGLWVFTRDGTGQMSEPISLFGNDKELTDLLAPNLKTASEVCVSNSTLICLELQENPGHVLLAAGVISGDEVVDVLVGLFPSTNNNSEGVPYDWAMTVAVDTISKWQMSRYVTATKTQIASLSSFVNMAAAINRTDNKLDASITLANELKAATETTTVALMLRNGRKGPFKLVAMSGVEFFDNNASTTQTIESTVLGLQEEPTFWSKNKDNQDGELKVNLQNFCGLFDSPGCGLLPLRDLDDHHFGWLLLGLTEDQCNNPQTEKHFQQISGLVAGQLGTVLRAQRTMTRVVLDNTRRNLKTGLAKKLGAMALLTTIAMCLPFTYKIPCDCELQLTSRRFVAAPYEGLLEKSLVASGDVVPQGAVLARMDARQLRMSLSGLNADMQSEQKKRDSALARGSVAESQIARAEMARLQSEISITEQRLNNTEIRSPIAGVIVSGDMEKAEGAPLEMGQDLFEVGPLEEMVVEIQIPEREIQYVQTDMTVHFEFEAFPFEIFSGTIQRIHPRAEIANNDSVFIAEVALQNEAGQLRPGLKGRAKISAGRHMLGWNLFHGAMEQGRRWLIW